MPAFPSTLARSSAAAAALWLAAGAVCAQGSNIEKLKQMKVATTDLNIPIVPQEGRNADRHREEPGAHQAAAGLQDRAVRGGARRAPHGRRRRAPICSSSARARPPSGP